MEISADIAGTSALQGPSMTASMIIGAVLLLASDLLPAAHAEGGFTYGDDGELTVKIGCPMTWWACRDACEDAGWYDALIHKLNKT